MAYTLKSQNLGFFFAHDIAPGFYTYGEIARTRGVNGYHNQTIVALALS